MEKKLNSFFTEYQPQISQIRQLILRSLVVFIVSCLLGLIFNRQIILFLISLFDLNKINVVLTSPYQFVNLSISISLLLGAIATTPVFIYYFMFFINPALKPEEFTLLKKLIPASLILFACGCLFGAKIEQFVISIYSQTTAAYSLNSFWDIQAFLSQLIIMSVTMGLIFQLPIVLTVLIRLHLITTQLLASQRRYVYLILTIFGVILPPTDILSLVLIITPLFFLFEGTLLLNRTN